MNIQQHIRNSCLNIIAKPNANKTEILGYDEKRQAIRIAVSAVPDKNKANKELLKFLSRLLKRKTELVRGARGKEKVIRIKER